MTNEEALKYFRYRLNCGQCGENTTQRKAFEKAIEEIEKQIPKKPIPVTPKVKNAQWFHKWQSCPSCNHCFGHCFRREEISYCLECGQAIDYSEIDE